MFIKFLVNNKDVFFVRFLVRMIYFPSILILEPLVWFRLILISFNYNFLKVFGMVFSFFKTGFKKMILRTYRA